VAKEVKMNIAKTIVLGVSALCMTGVLAGEMVFSLEEPPENGSMTGVANIRGWAAGSAGIDYVDLWIDSVYVGRIPYGGTRRDVGNAYPQYPDSDLAGFSMAYNYSLLKAGEHQFTVTAVDNDAASQTIERTFSVAKFQQNYFAAEAPMNTDAASMLPWGDDMLTTNVDMAGSKFALLVGWDKSKQNLNIKSTFPAGYDPGTNDGDYEGFAVSDVPVDFENEVCGNAVLLFNLANGVLTGTGIVDLGEEFTASAAIGSGGIITGGVIEMEGFEVLQFGGSMTAGILSGTWQDILGCGGRWYGVSVQ
jgi:hypothetical protein